MEYFHNRYQPVFKEISADSLFEEFCDYQGLSDADIGKDVWEAAKVVDGIDEDGTEVTHYRADVLWWYIGNMKQPGTSVKRFRYLSKIAEAVLIIPHSNAEEEHLFSIVRKNKTESPSSLKLDGTLSSILAMKCSYPESNTPCYKWIPDDELLTSSKKATATYNREHRN